LQPQGSCKPIYMGDDFLLGLSIIEIVHIRLPLFGTAYAGTFTILIYIYPIRYNGYRTLHIYGESFWQHTDCPTTLISSRPQLHPNLMDFHVAPFRFLYCLDSCVALLAVYLTRWLLSMGSKPYKFEDNQIPQPQ
jgi:hypothetical protein